MPSRIRDKTWTRGERDSTRFQNQPERPAARSDNPDPDTLREYIEDGHCWWCERGPFKSLASHTFGAHGILGSRLKEMAGIPKTHPICDPSLSDRFRKRILDEVSLGVRPSFSTMRPHSRTRDYSVAGLAVQKAKLDRWKRENPDWRDTTRLLRAPQMEARRRPHPCPICGTTVPTATPICCGPACSEEAARLAGERVARAGKRWHETMTEEEHTEWRAKLSAGMRSSDKGRWK